ncbi:PP2C family protein-serine/threonine phosphatase [Amycolatopsis regifaucium]|uniref:Translation initiation factor IF-2 n=1 Tax=Amycolatopsis regifaucium TaxID=546365 RepID=A0A154MMU3_9PSEU|nr:PP2C family protein-serine/threonine phosphatase [Amycolatopsis regifaucium]KZB85390.1 translation initiation factor IF-2 [Amycolatopsis regifaucium]OKA09002.1 translation initiation factor IF-2 [Amycolatopsis regifaucium]SFJ38626.1 Serine phosphatase RsbU, regulator of sigma subunit [Amycolatopsis regifaucium]
MTHPHVARLRRRLRQVCAAAGVPAEDRARLVLAVTLLAEAAGDTGGQTRLSSSTVDNRLAVTLRLPQSVGQRRRNALPLLPDAGDSATLTWYLGTGNVAVAVPDDDEAATREEMLALAARADVIAKEQRELKHELAETNSGVLAMYVELEERDEQLRRAHAVIFRELEDALRPPPPRVDGFELAVHYAPSEPDSPTGGDLYDWFVLPDGNLHVTLVDAVGHGVTSTRHALTVTHAIRTLALEGHPLDDLIARAARTLATIEPDLMATVLLARLDPVTGDVTIANGSHPRPVLLTAAGDTELLVPALVGRGVGFPDPGTGSLVRRTLAPGDLLLLYTDGLTESRKNHQEGEARLLAAAPRHTGKPTVTIPSALATEMHDVVLHADDTVVIAIRREPVIPSATPLP